MAAIASTSCPPGRPESAPRIAFQRARRSAGSWPISAWREHLVDEPCITGGPAPGQSLAESRPAPSLVVDLDDDDLDRRVVALRGALDLWQRGAQRMAHRLLTMRAGRSCGYWVSRRIQLDINLSDRLISCKLQRLLSIIAYGQCHAPANSLCAVSTTTLSAGLDVVPTRLGDALIARITQAIHDGRLKPGDALPSEAGSRPPSASASRSRAKPSASSRRWAWSISSRAR